MGANRSCSNSARFEHGPCLADGKSVVDGASLDQAAITDDGEPAQGAQPASAPAIAGVGLAGAQADRAPHRAGHKTAPQSVRPPAMQAQRS